MNRDLKQLTNEIGGLWINDRWYSKVLLLDGQDAVDLVTRRMNTFYRRDVSRIEIIDYDYEFKYVFYCLHIYEFYSNYSLKVAVKMEDFIRIIQENKQ